jgi:DNA-binding winged helix-turn-helix (wHTH) protein
LADYSRFIETLPKRGYRFIANVPADPRGPERQGARTGADLMVAETRGRSVATV